MKQNGSELPILTRLPLNTNNELDIPINGVGEFTSRSGYGTAQEEVSEALHRKYAIITHNV